MAFHHLAYVSDEEISGQKKLGPPTSILTDIRKNHTLTLHHEHQGLPPSPFFGPMDSPLLNQLFRQLFNHRACQCTRSTSVRRLNGTRPGSATLRYQQQSRSFLSRRETSSKKTATNDGTMWTKRDDYPRDLDQQLRTFPLVTAKDLRNRRERPRQVKMLTREFIEGMVYSHKACYKTWLRCCRQLIQSPLWILLQTRNNLPSWRTL